MPVRQNAVKRKLAAGESVFGSMIFEFLSPGLPQMSLNAGAEFLFYDMEHSGFAIPQMREQFALCRGLSIAPLVRPPGKQYQYVSNLAMRPVSKFFFDTLIHF